MQAVHYVGKTWFVLHTKHALWKIYGSTSFAIDNMYYVNFKIQEQESVPWCGEIQNPKLKVLENTLNLHSNFTCALEVWSFNQFIWMCLREDKRASNTHIQTISLPYKILYVFFFITDYLIGLAFLAIPIGI